MDIDKAEYFRMKHYFKNMYAGKYPEIRRHYPGLSEVCMTAMVLIEKLETTNRELRVENSEMRESLVHYRSQPQEDLKARELVNLLKEVING